MEGFRKFNKYEEKRFWKFISAQLHNIFDKSPKHWKSKEIKKFSDDMSTKLDLNRKRGNLEMDCILDESPKKLKLVSTITDLFKYPDYTIIRNDETKHRFTYFLELLPAHEYIKKYDIIDQTTESKEIVNLLKLVKELEENAEIINEYFDKRPEFSNFSEKFNLLHDVHIVRLNQFRYIEAHSILRKIYELLTDFKTNTRKTEEDPFSGLDGFQYDSRKDIEKSIQKYLSDTNEVSNENLTSEANALLLYKSRYRIE